MAAAIDFELRPWRTDDLPSLLRHANDAGIADNMTDLFPHPYTEADGLAFLQRVMAMDPPNVMALVINGEAVGSVGIFPQQDIFRRNAEFGYWLAREHWGKGIMRVAVVRMCAYAFNTFPEIDRLFARPFGSNHASQRVLERAGFTLEATFTGTLIKKGRVEDELIYALRR